MENETTWIVDQSHSEVAFRVRHLMISHIRGKFKKFDANIHTTQKDFLTAEIDVWIDPASISTDDEKRDEHLKSADFFNVEKYKQITFTSTTIIKADDHENHELWGTLTMLGISKNIKLYVEFGGINKDPWGNEKAGFTITGKVNRSDWGLTWNASLDSGGFMVSDEVSLHCELVLINAGSKDREMVIESAEMAETKS